MRIWLLRHGETAYNAEKRYLGRTDVSLSPQGRAALERAPFSPGRVYVSPLRRTAETAEILFPDALTVPVEGLGEMDFGIFEGKNYREMADWPAYRAWVDGGCLGQIPGGEGKSDFCRRTCAAFSQLVEQGLAEGENALVIVAHGGTQMAVMEQYARPAGDYFSWRGPCGGGFVLDAAPWRPEGTLTLLETVEYTKGGRTWN